MTEPQMRDASRQTSCAGMGLTSRLDVNRLARLMVAKEFDELRNHVDGLTLDEQRRTLVSAVFQMLREREAHADTVFAA